MNIGNVAARCGLPAKTIRYYEDIGLVRPLRGSNGYRSFRDTDLHKLIFLARARTLGFSIDDCRTLLGLYEDKHRESQQVRAVAEEHLRRIDDKIEQLTAMRATLSALVQACHGDDRPECPIIDDLSGGDPAL